MLGDNAGDMVINHHHLVDQPPPLRREHADRRGTAAHAHTLFELAIYHRRSTGLHDHCRPAIDCQFDRQLVAERKHGIAGDPAFSLGTAGQVMHAAQRQHLRAILPRRDMADRLALRPHCRGLCAQMPVRVDLHLDAAIGENALGDDGYQIHILDLLADDERRGLIVGIGRSRPDRRDEGAVPVYQLATPLLHIERHHRSAAFHRVVENAQRVAAHDPSAEIAIAVAGARAALGDVAHDGTGVAAQLFGHLLLAGIVRFEALGEFAHHRGPQAGWKQGGGGATIAITPEPLSSPRGSGSGSPAASSPERRWHGGSR